MAMFRAREDSEQRKIRLPKRIAPPTLEYLQFILEQAQQYKGQEVEVTWTEALGARQFILIAKLEREKNDANWKLWEDNGRQSQLVWSYDTIDIELIDNMLSMLNTNSDATPPTPTRASSSPTSPYRNILSASYHRIAPVNSSLRESLIGMRSLTPPKPVVLNNLEPIVAQTVSTGALTPVTLSENAPSFAIKKIITDGLKQAAGNRQIMPVITMSDTTVTGTLEQTGMQNVELISLINTQKLTGKLEFNAQEVRAEVFFNNGDLDSAFTSNCQGNEAMTELLMCPPSGFRFTTEEQSPIHNLSQDLKTFISNVSTIRDQLSHLEKAGLKPQTMITKIHENLSDSELKMFLMKNGDADIVSLITLYKELNRKFTLSQFLSERQMSKSLWVPILYSFYACGLIEMRPPLSTNDEQLEFLGDAQAAVQALKTTFIRKETGILTYPAFLYFLQYEFLRFQSYDWPLSLIIFEMSKQSPQPGGGLDLIDHQETLAALQRIAAIKRPLDHLGHFEAINYALLLPGSGATIANQIAHQMIQVIRSQPLSNDLDDKSLKLSFGIASIPSPCSDIHSMITQGKKALMQAKNGHFPVILAQNEK